MTTLGERVFEVAANWKLVAAVSAESYHFENLHRNSVARWLHDNAIFDAFGNHCRWGFPLKSIEAFHSQPQDSWPNEIHGSLSHLLFPGTVVIANGMGAQIIRTEPGDGVGYSKIRYLGVYRATGSESAARTAYDFGGNAFEQEDLVAVADSHRGLTHNGGTFFVGTNEVAQVFLHQKWRELLVD